MAKLDDALRRSTLMAQRIQQRTDLSLRQTIEEFTDAISFLPLEEMMISEGAWEHVANLGIEPKLVFAHPSLLRQHPSTSQYYRGIALLPRKRVTEIAGSVDSWESESQTTTINEDRLFRVVKLYNAAISSIIEGSTQWTIENGYRNIIANMGIGLDGTFRNIIGQDAEELVRARIKDWLEGQKLILGRNADQTLFELPDGYRMRYSSEPDIEFSQVRGTETTVVSTIEIKGGKDPAGALERLGAIQKSFEATPPACVNMLIAGVITPEMQERLDSMGLKRTFLLDELVSSEDRWIEFLNEVFHYTLRITPVVVKAEE